MSESSSFGAVDYTVFGLMLVISAAIGIYHRFSGGRQKTTKEYLLADGDMAVLPVAFSLMASFMSAITLLGVASENYSYGAQFVLINIAYMFGTPIAAFVFLPVFFRMQATSAYEYLEIRFGRPTRLIASFVFILHMVLYMSIVLYAPALALSAVTGISQWIAIVSVGVVCTFYCTIGGMKAVLWADVFQSALMFMALFAVIIQGCLDVGGLNNVFQIAYDGGRLNFANFSFDPSERHTVWSLAIGGIFVFTSIYGVNQAQIQRLLTVKSLKRAQLALFFNWPITTLLSLTTSLTGLVIYANLSHCDPLLRPLETNVRSPDQLLPYYVMQSLGKYPGVSGLFVAGIFSGALSTVSSSVNSLAAVTLEDFIKPCVNGPNKQMTDSRSTLISKILAFSYGVLCVALTYVAEQLGGVLQASLTVFGVVGGPLLGLFTLGMLFPKANQKGAVIGFLSALLFCLWIGFGTTAAGIKPIALPLSDKGCLVHNSTVIESNIINFTQIPFEEALIEDDYSVVLLSNTTFIGTEDKKEVFWPYRLSYMWYSGLGWILTLLVGMIVSYITGVKTDLDPKLLSPILKSCTFCERKKTRLRKKLDEIEETDM